jgi:hypothetical protein
MEGMATLVRVLRSLGYTAAEARARLEAAVEDLRAERRTTERQTTDGAGTGGRGDQALREEDVLRRALQIPAETGAGRGSGTE